jgi:hypothetical protein
MNLILILIAMGFVTVFLRQIYGLQPNQAFVIAGVLTGMAFFLAALTQT